MSTVQEIKANNIAAYREVYDAYHEKVYYYAYSKTKSAYLSEEVLQLTFIKLWNYRSSLKEELSISTQIFRIATTTLIDLIRKQKNVLMLANEVKNSNQNTQHVETYSKISLAEINELLDETLKKMPPERMKIFEMNRFVGMTYTQIASELSISVKNVEKQISKALKQIRVIFPEKIFIYFFAFQLDLLINQGGNLFSNV